MSVTNENRKIRSWLRSSLSELCKKTNGKVDERQGSGGKIVSKYIWNIDGESFVFNYIWHNSVSDRFFGKKACGQIRKYLKDLQEVFDPKKIVGMAHLVGKHTKGMEKYSRSGISINADQSSVSKIIEAEIRSLDDFDQSVNDRRIWNYFSRKRALSRINEES